MKTTLLLSLVSVTGFEVGVSAEDMHAIQKTFSHAARREVQLQRTPTAEASRGCKMNRFASLISEHGLWLRWGRIATLQINVGRKCNQACTHCHVDAAPWRREMMAADVGRRVSAWIREHRPPLVDLTGGAPELSDHFRYLVETAREAGAQVIDRNNLTIIETAGFAWLPEYLAAHEVEVVASLPCHVEANVNAQRGVGVFAKSLVALRRLNAVGYRTRLPLDLVYNPMGPKLPPPQAELEADSKRELRHRHGIEFTRLFTITNQPIARSAEELRRQGQWDSYRELLANSFNPATVEGLMCRSTISVGMLGEVYDCDFNQMLGMQVRNGQPLFLRDVTPAYLENREIQTGDHCLACTAGCGSSCTGAVAPPRTTRDEAFAAHRWTRPE